MKKISSKSLKAGMIVAQDVLSKQGQSIAKAGTTLNAALIAKLSFYRIPEIYVEEDENIPNMDKKEEKKPAKDLEDIKPKNETIAYSERLKSTPEFQEFSLNYSKNVAELRTAYLKILGGNGDEIKRDKLLKGVETLFISHTALELFDLLHTMRTVDDSIYAHGVNVALVTRAIGKWLKWGKEELNTLTLAGLLYDIGKIKIPAEVLNKSGKLTDEEFAMIRNHPRNGYELLKEVPNLEPEILNAALKHHERFDGSGYPDGLLGEDIDDMAAVVAIADVYDAMTASRSYRTPKSAFQVIAMFEDDGVHKYNPKFILTFLQNIANAYQNNRVILSDGTSARIIYINQNRLSRPMVQLDDGSVIDLSRQADLEITRCL